MSVELKIPNVGESIQEVLIGQWLKREGEAVEKDQTVVELETDKASMELSAPAAGVLTRILKQAGDKVAVGETIAQIDEKATKAGDSTPNRQKSQSDTDDKTQVKASASEKASTSDQPAPQAVSQERAQQSSRTQSVPVTPSARRALRQYGVNPEEIEPAGKRVRREDVMRYVESHPRSAEPASVPAQQSEKQPVEQETHGELEEVVPMSLIRRRIAARLVEAKQQAALLTTFNEADMTEVMELRKKYKESFEARYGIKLGFMSFFVKAVIDALKQFPELNAEIRDKNIVYRHYYHIGIAIGSQRGLVVPVLRHAERLTFAEIEGAINDFAERAGNNKLKPHELEGGTFTISNGGIYGSLLSTPIVNPPQSGVLGMHVIQDRPVAREGQVVIRPMMYLALTYDHRIVDGREAVSFLKRIKEGIEEPSRILIEA